MSMVSVVVAPSETCSPDPNRSLAGNVFDEHVRGTRELLVNRYYLAAFQNTPDAHQASVRQGHLAPLMARYTTALAAAISRSDVWPLSPANGGANQPPVVAAAEEPEQDIFLPPQRVAEAVANIVLQEEVGRFLAMEQIYSTATNVRRRHPRGIKSIVGGPMDRYASEYGRRLPGCEEDSLEKDQLMHFVHGVIASEKDEGPPNSRSLPLGSVLVRALRDLKLPQQLDNERRLLFAAIEEKRARRATGWRLRLYMS